MELLITGIEGISPDSIVSVRAGAVRRQAPVSGLSGPFKFPCKPEECGNLKVDVFAPRGSARKVIRPGVGTYRLALQPPKDVSADSEGFRQGGNMELEFSIKPDLAGEGGKEPVKSPLAGTEEYLEDHGFMAFLQGILAGVIKEKPANPYEFVAKQFQDKMPKPASNPKESEIPPPVVIPPASATLVDNEEDSASNPLVGEAEAPAPSAITLPMEADSCASAQPAATRDQPPVVLEQADAETTQVPPETPAFGMVQQQLPAVEQLRVARTEALRCLLEGGDSGALENALIARKGTSSRMVQRAGSRGYYAQHCLPDAGVSGALTAFPSRWAPEGTAAPAAQSEQVSLLQNRLEEVHSEIAGLKTMLGNFADQLPQLLRENAALRAEEAAVVAAVEEVPAEDNADLRCLARDTLTQSAAGGHLAGALSGIRDGQPEEPTTSGNDAGFILSQAVVDPSLTLPMPEIPEEACPETPAEQKQRVCAALLTGLDGDLDSASAPATKPAEAVGSREYYDRHLRPDCGREAWAKIHAAFKPKVKFAHGAEVRLMGSADVYRLREELLALAHSKLELTTEVHEIEYTISTLSSQNKTMGERLPPSRSSSRLPVS